MKQFIQNKLGFAPVRGLSSLHPRIRSLCKAYVGALLIGLGAQISIPLWFTVVPLTGQTLALSLVAATLTPREGVKAVLFYMAHGALGLPFWAGGAFGAAVLVGPTGGYIWAYLIQVYLISKVSHHFKESSPYVLFSIFLSISLTQLLLGSLWLAYFITFRQGFSQGFFPFVLGAFLNSALITSYLKFKITKQGETS